MCFGTIAAMRRLSVSCAVGAAVNLRQEDAMKKLLGTAALLAAGLLGPSGAASAASLPDAASIGASATSQVERVDFSPFRHCHGPRWDRRCHGGTIFFRDRDRRDRDGYRHRGRERDRYDRRDRDRGQGDDDN
jgi:hypothetical protein